MKLEHIDEPRLRFQSGEHICPRRGITAYGAFDRSMGTRRTDVIVGGVGSATCNEALERWVTRCASEIPGMENAKQPNLRVGFPGMNLGHGFDATLKFSQDLARTIKKSEVDEIVAIADRRSQDPIDQGYRPLLRAHQVPCAEPAGGCCGLCDAGCIVQGHFD
jgi:hypothetical protein